MDRHKIVENVQDAIRNVKYFFPLDFFSPLCYTKIFNSKGIKFYNKYYAPNQSLQRMRYCRVALVSHR